MERPFLLHLFQPANHRQIFRQILQQFFELFPYRFRTGQAAAGFIIAELLVQTELAFIGVPDLGLHGCIYNAGRDGENFYAGFSKVLLFLNRLRKKISKPLWKRNKPPSHPWDIFRRRNWCSELLSAHSGQHIFPGKHSSKLPARLHFTENK